MKRGRIDQEWCNRLKVLRTAIRLKYSILADNELNAKIDEERKAFYKAVQHGKLLRALDAHAHVKKTVDEKPGVK